MDVRGVFADYFRKSGGATTSGGVEVPTKHNKLLPDWGRRARREWPAAGSRYQRDSFDKSGSNNDDTYRYQPRARLPAAAVQDLADTTNRHVHDGVCADVPEALPVNMFVSIELVRREGIAATD